MAVSWYAWFVLVATALGATIAPQKQLVEKSICGRVWPTIHSPTIPKPGGNLFDAIELNWNFSDCGDIPTKIGLFESLPTTWDDAISIYNITAEEGFIVTSISLGEPTLPAGWENGVGSKGPQCLWPWVGAGDDKIEAHNCLKIQPTWMEDYGDKINEMKIGDLALPGTHNAGAWRFDTEISSVARDSFVLCQDRSIWAQLVHGIRYLDFRIAYYEFYPNIEDRYWLNHNLIRVRALLPLLREIRTFMDNTKEVVILDAHHFPIGFYEQNGAPIRHVHAGLLELVQRELGPHLAPFRDFNTGVGSKGPTLSAFINSGKRLVFNYVDNSIVSQNDWLWPVLPHLWANTNNPYELFHFLDDAIDASPRPNARNPMHSAMAQTTPSVFDIMFLRGSLRTNADEVNRNVTTRLSTLWRANVNIVSSDFFLGNDVIDVSIAITLERSGKL